MKASAGPYFIEGNKIVSPSGYNIATVNSHTTTEGAATARLLASSFEMRDLLISSALALQNTKSSHERNVLDKIEALLKRVV